MLILLEKKSNLATQILCKNMFEANNIFQSHKNFSRRGLSYVTQNLRYF